MMNFNVVQKMRQRNQTYNDKKKDEILEEQLQQINEDEQMHPAVILDNPYQDIDKIISKAKSQQKVPQMKKAKSTYSTGSGNKILKPESSFVGENEPFNNNRKFGFHDAPNAFQSNQNTYKTMFQVKKQKKKERVRLGTGFDQTDLGHNDQSVQSWRNFGNVGAFSQRKQQAFQRGTVPIYMKKEKLTYNSNTQSMPTEPSNDTQINQAYASAP